MSPFQKIKKYLLDDSIFDDLKIGFKQLDSELFAAINNMGATDENGNVVAYNDTEIRNKIAKTQELLADLQDRFNNLPVYATVDSVVTKDALAAELKTINAKFPPLAEADKKNGEAIEDLSADVRTNKSDISQLKKTVSQLQASGYSATDIQRAITTAQQDISNIKASLGSKRDNSSLIYREDLSKDVKELLNKTEQFLLEREAELERQKAETGETGEDDDTSDISKSQLLHDLERLLRTTDSGSIIFASSTKEEGASIYGKQKFIVDTEVKVCDSAAMFEAEKQKTVNEDEDCYDYLVNWEDKKVYHIVAETKEWEDLGAVAEVYGGQFIGDIDNGKLYYFGGGEILDLSGAFSKAWTSAQFVMEPGTEKTLELDTDYRSVKILALDSDPESRTNGKYIDSIAFVDYAYSDDGTQLSLYNDTEEALTLKVIG